MRYLFILFFFCVPLFHINAQPSLHMGYNLGGVFSQLQYNRDVVMPFDSEQVGVWMNLRLWMQGKYWQAGLSTETGMIRQQVELEVVHYEQGQLINSTTISLRHDIASPAISPMLYGHIKLDIPKGGYMYAGPAAGFIFGRNSVGYSHPFRTFAGGMDWGISFRLSKRVQFEIGHAWRFTKIPKNTGIYYLSPPTGPGSYTGYRMTDIRLDYVTNTVGVSFLL